MAVTKVNEQNFQTEVLQSAETVLVDFYADWCGPCKMLSPVVDEIAGEVRSLMPARPGVRTRCGFSWPVH